MSTLVLSTIFLISLAGAFISLGAALSAAACRNKTATKVSGALLAAFFVIGGLVGWVI
jgi:hypothetical protein